MKATLHFITVPTLLTLAVLASPAAARSQSPDDDSAPRLEINLTGIDLGSAEGVDIARHRINGAARAVCSNVPDPDGAHLQTSACVLAARARANRQLLALHELALARRARTEGDHPVKTALIP